MQFGAHLPLIDFDATGFAAGDLARFTDTARRAGSSARDYEAVGVPFEERWPRLDEAVRVLRAHLKSDAPAFAGKIYDSKPPLEPRPNRPEGPPIWIGSWGSDAGLRRVARSGDGWLASAYNTTPEQMAEGRDKLLGHLVGAGKDPDSFPIALATMWSYVTRDSKVAAAMLERLARMLNREPGVVGSQVLIGPPEECASKLRRYARIGVDRVFIWPIGDANTQIETFMRDVAPLV